MREKITCVIIDDEPLASDVLKGYLAKMSDFEIIGIYNDAIKPVRELKNFKVDAIFCDIEMPYINGLQLLETLCVNQNREALKVIVSAHSKYAVDGFNIDAFDYLLKPVSFDRFIKTTEKIHSHLKNKNIFSNESSQNIHPETIEYSGNYFFIKSRSKLIKINHHEVLYIEALGDYVKIHLDQSPKSVMILDSLKNLEESLPKNKFKRIHRSYLVAISQIKGIEYKKVIIGENIRLPISNSYFEDLYEALIKGHILLQ